jgi:hypothetical protein
MALGSGVKPCFRCIKSAELHLNVKKTQRLYGNFHVIDRGVRFRDPLADFAHSLEVRSQSILKIPAGFSLGVTSCRTSVNIRRIGGITGPGRFDDYRIALTLISTVPF